MENQENMQKEVRNESEEKGDVSEMDVVDSDTYPDVVLKSIHNMIRGNDYLSEMPFDERKKSVNSWIGFFTDSMIRHFVEDNAENDFIKEMTKNSRHADGTLYESKTAERINGVYGRPFVESISDSDNTYKTFFSDAFTGYINANPNDYRAKMIQATMLLDVAPDENVINLLEEICESIMQGSPFEVDDSTLGIFANLLICYGLEEKIGYTPQEKPTPQTQPTEQSDDGCYIATAVYGSYDCPQVWTLRRYRDQALRKTIPGQLFIKTYYAISPTLVRWFGNTDIFKTLAKRTLDKWIDKLGNKYDNSRYED
jgi:hypothetical protein